MPPDDRVRLQHMIDWGREALAIVAGIDQSDLERDRIRYLALLRTLEVIGEAARQVSAESRTALPHLPWRNIVWSTATDDLPTLLAELERYLAASDDTTNPERNPE